MGKDNTKQETPAPEKMTAEKRVENLERCVAKLAHYSGTEKLLREFGIERWTPDKDDMRRFRG